MIGAPLQLRAQTTNKPAPPKKPAAAITNSVAAKPPDAKPKSPHPFHGKLAAVDKAGKSLTCGKSVYLITAETKITKDGKPATIEDGVVGEPVSGYVVPNKDGKLAAKTVRFWPKPESKSTEKKRKEE